MYGEVVHVETATKPRAVSNMGRRLRRDPSSLSCALGAREFLATAVISRLSLSLSLPSYRFGFRRDRAVGLSFVKHELAGVRPSPCNAAPRGREQAIY